MKEESHPDNIEFSDQRLLNRRQLWASYRFRMEMENLRTRRYGNSSRHYWYKMLFLMKATQLLLKAVGLYKTGVRNAENFVLREMPLYFPNLPSAFDGFTVLHLSDLHLDGMQGIEDRILRLLGGREVDICVLTGDYRTELHGLHRHIIEKLQYLIRRIRSVHGFYGILGNHDGCHMVNPMEQIGIRMLINASVAISLGTDRIRLIGTDDVHYYFTDQALHALEHAGNDFCIALVHSPELFDSAAMMGVDLYLCGHTHAGQICLPGFGAMITHLDRGRKFYRGHWRHGNMQGVTSAGVGTSGIPIRFNTRGEMLLYTLYRQAIR